MAENKDPDQFNPKKDYDHQDHQLNYNVDVTGCDMRTSSGESSSARDFVSTNQTNKPPTLPLLGFTEKDNGDLVPVYYSETLLFAPTSQVISGDVKSLSVEEYNDWGLEDSEFLKDDNLAGFIVGPLVQESGYTDFRCEPLYAEGSGESSLKEKDVADHDQKDGSISKDPKNGKK